MHAFGLYTSGGSGTKHFVSILESQLEVHLLLVESEAVGHLIHCTKQRHPSETVSNLKV